MSTYARPDLIALTLRRPRPTSDEIFSAFPSYVELLAMGRTWEAKTLRVRFRQAARSIADKAVRSGQVPRRSDCQICGGTYRLAKHHPDYEHPLLVQWLCHPCHVRADVERRAWERPFTSGELATPEAMRRLANAKIGRAEKDLLVGRALLERADEIEASVATAIGRAA